MWKRDSSNFHSYGIHLKLAHTVSDQDFKDVRNAIIKDPHFVGIGEICFHFLFPTRHSRLNCARSFSSCLSRRCYSARSWSFTAETRRGALKLQNLAQKTLAKDLPTFDRDIMKIHHHCFNGGITVIM